PERFHKFAQLQSSATARRAFSTRARQRLCALSAWPPAAEHFMCLGSLQRLVRRHDAQRLSDLGEDRMYNFEPHLVRFLGVAKVRSSYGDEHVTISRNLWSCFRRPWRHHVSKE